jgi:hypothetical protein
LRVLQRAGLVTQRKSGRTRRCRLTARPLQKAQAWLAQYRVFWETQLDALGRYLTQTQTEESEWPKNSSPPKQR